MSGLPRLNESAGNSNMHWFKMNYTRWFKINNLRSTHPNLIETTASALSVRQKIIQHHVISLSLSVAMANYICNSIHLQIKYQLGVHWDWEFYFKMLSPKIIWFPPWYNSSMVQMFPCWMYIVQAQLPILFYTMILKHLFHVFTTFAAELVVYIGQF